MNKIVEKILAIDKVICKNIKVFDESERGLLSQNILAQLRNFIEHIGLFFYANGKNIEYSYNSIEEANKFVKANGKLRVLSKFQKFLQISASHYTLGEENSERLMLKYYEYLIRLKVLMKSHNIDILENIDDFPLDTDKTLKEYYEKIATKLNDVQFLSAENEYNDKYYIQKTKPFFVDHKIFYEVNFIVANDYSSKFDRMIAFTKSEILPNYAVKLTIRSDKIDILGKKMPILLIDDWEVAIRGCEINHFASLFGKHSEISIVNKEYNLIMSLLKNENVNLLDIVQFEDDHFQRIKDIIIKNANASHIITLLEKCRVIIKNNLSGHNILRYLLYVFNNRIIKLQKSSEQCRFLSDLFISTKSIPFDKMPFNTSLRGHNPSIYDLFQCIDSEGREHEIFARLIRNNTEQNGSLYTDEDDLEKFEDIDGLINGYNSKLYSGHRPLRQLEKFCNHIYVNEYENNVYKIIKELQKRSNLHISGYSSSTESWLDKSDYKIDCEEKKKYLINMFDKSSVALIYGSAGTGKSTLINHISNRFGEYYKIYLANTNPAVDNLRRKVKSSNTLFMTVAKYLNDPRIDSECFILFIDECSALSNADMIKIIEKTDFKLLVLVGDIYQIEAIIFGNWFGIAKSFIHKNSIFELTKPYRTENKDLLTLWNSVRNMEDNVLELITRNNYSNSLDETIFTKNEEDEIILCLNYNGLYGINNINKFLQVANPNREVSWGGHKYKAEDPILFNDTKRFGSVIYNNLKGKIISILKKDDIIYFDTEIDKAISELEANFNNLEFVGTSEKGQSIVRFYVDKYKNYDDDNEAYPDTVVPFQIAYAVSIHKAQGLEYDSVKVVITDEVDEMITHNIFYTAITRARKKLKIYWTPETENKVLNNFKQKNIQKDVNLLSKKYEELKPSE